MTSLSATITPRAPGFAGLVSAGSEPAVVIDFQGMVDYAKTA